MEVGAEELVKNRKAKNESLIGKASDIFAHLEYNTEMFVDKHPEP